VKMWVKEFLTEDTSRQRATMNDTISQLHKGGGTNKTSDQRPVVLLNSVYQLLNYVINERLKKIVEPANILKPGQSGGRQGCCVGINMQKFINALLRMLTVTGQNEDISHGMQIGKDQKGERDEKDYQFSNIVFIDDISIFADTPEGMQKLLNVVQEFTAWCGMRINVKKTYL